MARAGAHPESALPNARTAGFWLLALVVFPAYAVYGRHVAITSDVRGDEALFYVLMAAPALFTILAGVLLSRRVREVAVATAASTVALIVAEVAYAMYLFRDWDDFD